jgi:hypothetical protein
VANLLLDVESKSDRRSIELARVDALLSGMVNSSKSCSSVLLDFADSFQGKGSCIPDVLFMYKNLSDSEQENFFHALKPLYMNQFTIFWLILERIIGVHKKIWTIDHIEFHLKKLSELYLSGNNVTPQMFHHMALLFQDQILMKDDAEKTNLYLLSIACIKKALHLDPENFILKLFLLLMYVQTGAIFAALDIFKDLDIKQIQLDTLSFMVSDHLISLINLENSDLFFHESFFVYEDSRTQSWNLICESLLRDNYTNIAEFFEFSQKLEQSIQAVSCIVNTIRLELLTKPLNDVFSYLNALNPDELNFDSTISFFV